MNEIIKKRCCVIGGLFQVPIVDLLMMKYMVRFSSRVGIVKEDKNFGRRIRVLWGFFQQLSEIRHRGETSFLRFKVDWIVYTFAVVRLSALRILEVDRNHCFLYRKVSGGWKTCILLQTNLLKLLSKSASTRVGWPTQMWKRKFAKLSWQNFTA